MFLNGVLLCILPLAVPLYAQPPLRHKLSDFVFSCNLLSNLKKCFSYDIKMYYYINVANDCHNETSFL